LPPNPDALLTELGPDLMHRGWVQYKDLTLLFSLFFYAGFVTVPNKPVTFTDRFAFSACGKLAGTVVTVAAGGESDNLVESKEVLAGVVRLYGTGAGGGGAGCQRYTLGKAD
jgi:hypothetical protein